MSLETHYRLCPKCHRSVPTTAQEHVCANDGTRMLEHCPRCQAPIRVPEAHFCANCGMEYRSVLDQERNVAVSDSPVGSTSPRDQNASSRRGRAAAILAILTIAGAVAFGWFSRLQIVDGNFVSEIAGTTLAIGLTTRDGQVFAYVCDGVRLGEWFKGKLGEDGNLDLVARSGSRLTARVAGGTANGTLRLNQGRTYTIAMASATGSSGLYRATRKDANTNVVAGWVVLRDGSQRGVVSINGTPSPAPKLDLGQLQVRIDGVGQLRVQRADPTQ
jgi:hypothetical protein